LRRGTIIRGDLVAAPPIIKYLTLAAKSVYMVLRKGQKMTRAEAEYRAFINEGLDPRNHYVAARNRDGTWRVDTFPLRLLAA
jgi:hypothetical protein